MDVYPKESTYDRSTSIKLDNEYSEINNTDEEVKIKDKARNEKESPSSERFYLIILAIVLILLSTIFYLISLIGCDDSTVVCLKNLRRRHVLIITALLLMSSFLFSAIYTLALYKKIHFTLPIYTSVIIWFLTYVYDTGADLKSHGSYNRVFLFTFMAISFIIQQFLIVIIYAIKKIGIWKGIFLFLILFGLGSYRLNQSLKNSCSNWTKGLKDTHIDMAMPGCKIKSPTYCWMNLLDNVFDVSGLMGDSCDAMRMDDRDQVLRWTKVRDAKVIGYPRVEKWKYFPDCTLDFYQFKVLANIMDMENPNIDELTKNKIEISVDYIQEKPEMKIRVQRDEKLVEERRIIREKLKLNEDEVLTKNVIHIFVDSLSRDNFRRKMPLTKLWLEKYFQNKDSETRSYQFFKYHGVAAWTYVNMVPSMFGVESGTPGSPIHANKYFKDSGFIMGQAYNYCGREFYDLEFETVDEYQWEPFDHEGNTLSCDPNYAYPGIPFNVFSGPYSARRRCLYGKDISSHIFKYGREFWTSYSTEPKYLRLAFLDAHEGTGEVVKYMDDLLVDFLNFLEIQGSLKDTVIILQSDHGTNMPGIYSLIEAQDHWIEKSLPSLFMIAPQTTANKYDKILTEKENYLLSPYDIHNTLLHLANAPKSAYNKIGESFFMDDHSYETRNCTTIKVIDPSFCQCNDQ